MVQFSGLASLRGIGELCRVVPFGDPWICALVQLPMAFRSFTRPSSPFHTQASTVCSSYLLSYTAPALRADTGSCIWYIMLVFRHNHPAGVPGGGYAILTSIRQRTGLPNGQHRRLPGLEPCCCRAAAYHRIVPVVNRRDKTESCGRSGGAGRPCGANRSRTGDLLLARQAL